MSTIKISQLPAASGPLSGSEVVPIVQGNVTKKAPVSSFTVGVNVKSFGAVCDGIADDTTAVQAAINYCAANNWPPLLVTGKCKITSSLIINRLVDQNSDEFFIVGDGPDAGFFTAGNVVIFNSTLPYTTDPQSEFVTFQNIRFESSSFFNAS